jgi:FolB domain-containing protein
VDHFAAADRICIEQLELHARVGVTDDERSKPQRIVLNLTIWPKATFDQVKDDITKTVDYAELCRSADRFVQSREWKLIETLASELCSHIVAEFPVNAAEVEVRKFVLSNTAFVSTTTRKMSEG